MTKRMWFGASRLALGLATAAGILVPAAAQAQITRVSGSEHRQAVGFNVGYFALRSEDARPPEDVLRVDLESLAFQIKDFNNGTFGGEWLITLNKYFEAGVGLNYYQETVPSVYRNFVNANNTEIQQELKLRIVPFTGTIRFLPIGHGAVEPYVGAGIGLFNWRYSETGEFVDFSDSSIFRDSYSASGNAFGGVMFGGVRVPFADVFAVGGEMKYQFAEGDIDADSGLLSNKIDLGGWSANFTFHIRF